MDTRLQPFLRAVHRVIPIFKSPELRPCLGDGQSMDYTESKSVPALREDTVEKDVEESKKQNHSAAKPTSCCRCTCQRWRECLMKVFPLFRTLRGYSVRYDLPCDIIAGLTVGIMHIPQGMAYVLLTQLPPVYGLYTSFFPVLVYCFFGTSRHISVGTFAAISMMVGAVVDKGHVAWQKDELQEALHDIRTGHNVTYIEDEEKVDTGFGSNLTGLRGDFRSQHLAQLDSIKFGYAMAVTFAVGILQLFFGVARLGFLAAFLSDPLTSGFTTGVAIHVFSSQIKYAFGINIPRFSGPFKLIYLYKEFFTNIHKTNLVTLSATAIAVVFLAGIKEGINDNKYFKKKMRGIPVPVELIMIIIGTVLSQHFSLHDEFSVQVIGHIPKGFPDFSVTFVEYLPDVIGESLAICFTAFAISFAASKIFADKHNYTIDPNQELIAHGLSNMFGPMFSSVCSSASLSRSMVQEGAGGRTQIVGLISSGLIIIVLLVLGPLFEPLPNCVLAAIVFVSLKRLFLQVGDLRILWRVSKVDCTVWLVTFLATVLLDIDLGLLVGLIYNLVPILLGTQQPYHSLLGRIPSTHVFVDINVYKQATPVPGIKIFRFEAPLYFANIENFKTALITETELDPHNLKQTQVDSLVTNSSQEHKQISATSETGPDNYHKENSLNEVFFPLDSQTYAIIIDLSPVQYMDSVTVRALREIILEYREVDVQVYLGNCKAQVSATLSESGFYNDVCRLNICATISQAVRVAQKCSTLSREDLTRSFVMDPVDFLEDKDLVNLDVSTQAKSQDEHLEDGFR